MISISFELETTGVGIHTALELLEEHVTSIVAEGVEVGAQAGIEHSRQVHGYTDRTHRLTDTAYPTAVSAGMGGAEAEMVWPQEYASFVDQFTPAHVIEGNPFLAFLWNGEFVTFRHVHHPGNKNWERFNFSKEALRVASEVLFERVSGAGPELQRILDAA